MVMISEASNFVGLVYKLAHHCSHYLLLLFFLNNDVKTFILFNFNV